MGLRKFSLSTANLLKIKNVILKTDTGNLKILLSKILKTENIEKIEELTYKLNQDIGLY